MGFSCLTSTETPKERLKRRQAGWDYLIDETERSIEKMRNEKLLSNDLPSEGQKEFYSGKNILITGATGFLGKVLIEKILRAIPTVGNIFVIVRPKKNQSPAERIATVLSNELFDTLKSQQPNALEKVIAITGDIALKGLGLSLEDRERLQNEVSVVFHSAASVRFDDPLQKAILMNTRGTREVVQLCKSMKNLKCLLHISTTYSNTDQEETLEKVYPTPIDWRYAVKLAETTSLAELEAISSKILGFQPNTYVFTKQLGEKVVDDARFDVPVIIVRPAVVVAIKDNPIPGWTDSFYGPIGFGIGMNKGVVRVLYLDPEIQLNYIPVDDTCLALLAAAWLRGTNTKIGDDSDTTDVVNASLGKVIDANYGDLKDCFDEMTSEHLITAQTLRAPRIDYTKNAWYYYYRLFVSHLLFAVIIDLILWLTGRKRQLLSVYRKVHNVNKKLLYYLSRDYPASSTNFYKLSSYVLEPDLQIHFWYRMKEGSYLQLTYCFEKLLKEPMSSKRVHKIFEVVHYVQQTIKYSIFTWLGWKCALFFLHRFMAYR